MTLVLIPLTQIISLLFDALFCQKYFVIIYINEGSHQKLVFYHLKYQNLQLLCCTQHMGGRSFKNLK